MSNYPPGTSASDPRAPWNAPDHSHDHEWVEDQHSSPLFEDNAAIFWENCNYAEGRWGEGWSCEESRRFRCEMQSVTKIREGEPNIEYVASTEDSADQFRYIETMFYKAIESVEWNKREEREILALDPPGHGDGFVKVRVGDYIIEYREQI